MFYRTLILSCFLFHYAESIKVVRTVAANGKGVDIRGCGVEGNVHCNSTQFAIFESNDSDEIILLKGIHTCNTNITSKIMQDNIHGTCNEQGHINSFGGIRFVQRDGVTPISGIFLHGGDMNTKNNSVIYDCEHKSRAFAFIGRKEGMFTTLSNFSVYNGSAYFGAGMFILNSAPIFNHLIWIQNEAKSDIKLNQKSGSGGGVVITGKDANPTFNSCIFENNIATYAIGDGGGNGGGGTWIESSAQPVFNDVIWIGNEAKGAGGGVYIKDLNTDPTFNNCIFEGNKELHTFYAGAGVRIENKAKPVFNNVLWIRNVATSIAGGAYIQGLGTIPTFNNCIFEENRALNKYYGGGGVRISLQAQPVFNNVSFIRNEAEVAGGGLLVIDALSKPIFYNCTFEDNKSFDSNYGGGGVWIENSAQPIFNNSIWIQNESPGFGGGAVITGHGTNPIFNNCTFIENKALDNNDDGYGGGGVYIYFGAQPIFNNVNWIRNKANSKGGGIYVTDANTKPTFNNCTCEENKALPTKNNRINDGGGALIDNGAHPIFNRVLWIRNDASRVGGGVSIRGIDTKPIFNNCTFVENKADHHHHFGGGGVFIEYAAQPIFNHVTWIHNSAQGHGGGVAIRHGTVKPIFDNCNFRNNTSDKQGGAIAVPFYPDAPSNTGECGTPIKFVNKILFSDNKANINIGNSIYIVIVQPIGRALHAVKFAPTCFRSGFLIFMNKDIKNKQLVKTYNNVATSPYKLIVDTPGTLTPTSLSPGLQLKGILQVQDVFGRSCSEIKGGDYSATVHLESDKRIIFEGSMLFLIREAGTVDISYSNELKIVSAPSNLVGKKIVLKFTQEKLQSVNTTITLRQCGKGFQSSLSNGLFTCIPCQTQQYNILPGGKCHSCPTIGAVCMGKNNVYVVPGYYGYVDKNKGEISVFECSGGQCCPHTDGFSLDNTLEINGLGCRIGNGNDCATNRDNLTPLCGACISGYSEILGSSICRKCTYVNWFWFIIPFPIGILFVVYLLRKTYLAATKNILFTLMFKNLMFFYQVVGLVLSPSQLAKRVTGPILMLFSFNIATSEADSSEINNTNTSLIENPFNCLVPDLTPIGKLAFNIYPMGMLLLLCWPICIYIFRKDEKKRANFGPAMTTCLLSLYASTTKFLIQLVNCRKVGGKLILYSAPRIICFEGANWLWQMGAILGIFGVASVPYLLFRYSKLKRVEEDGFKNNRWMLVVTKSYRDECWWYTSIDMGRRLFLISIAALPIDHESKLLPGE
eukprot:g872.t1